MEHNGQQTAKTLQDTYDFTTFLALKRDHSQKSSVLRTLCFICELKKTPLLKAVRKILIGMCLGDFFVLFKLLNVRQIFSSIKKSKHILHSYLSHENIVKKAPYGDFHRVHAACSSSFSSSVIAAWSECGSALWGGRLLDTRPIPRKMSHSLKSLVFV